MCINMKITSGNGISRLPMLDQRIKKVFWNVLNVELEDNTASTGTIDNWDSLGHIRLIKALEDEFCVRFEFSEIIELLSVKKIKEILSQNPNSTH